MNYEGKYKEMAEQFKADGCDDYTIEKFLMLSSRISSRDQ